MRLLDRYLVRSFFFNYVLACGVLMGMYILLDLIINFARFTKASGNLGGAHLFLVLMTDIGDYYMYQSLVIFQQICAAIPLLAAGFTMVRMTRNNELTAMLASGVSLYRIALPIILCAIFFSLLLIANQEWLMPRCVDKLLREHDDVAMANSGSQANSGRTADGIYFLKDSDNSLLLASSYDSKAQTLDDVRIIERDANGNVIGRILAPHAVWQVNPETSQFEWHMVPEALQIDDHPSADPTARLTERASTGLYRVTSLLTPQQLDIVEQRKAVDYLSTAQIIDLIRNSPDLTKPALEKVMHIRFTQPIMNIILLLIGIPFLLTRTPRRMVQNMIYCTLVTGVCFIGTFVLFQMAGTTVGGIPVPAIIGAWLPVLIFGPLSLAMLDTIKT
jgi:lipopolysaccharide export system permease protein